MIAQFTACESTNILYCRYLYVLYCCVIITMRVNTWTKLCLDNVWFLKLQQCNVLKSGGGGGGGDRTSLVKKLKFGYFSALPNKSSTVTLTHIFLSTNNIHFRQQFVLSNLQINIATLHHITSGLTVIHAIEPRFCDWDVDFNWCHIHESEAL